MTPKLHRKPWQFSEEFTIDLLTLKESHSKEILGQTDEPKNWKGVIIAIAIILATSALIVAAIMLVMPKQTIADLRDDISLNDILGSEYQPRGVDIQWLPGPFARYAHIDSYGNMVETNATTKTVRLLISNDTLKKKEVDHAMLSHSGRYVLLSTKTVNVRSYTKQAKYTVYDLELRKDCPVKNQSAFLQYAAWIPGTEEVVYVEDNNMYAVKDICQPTKSTTAVSKTGALGSVYNGIPDPLYEDEILKTDNVIWPSKDGKWLVYATFNDSQLPSYQMPVYDSERNEYSPVIVDLRYPKAGSKAGNPSVTLRIVNTSSIDEGTVLQQPSQIMEREYYMTAAKWVDEHNFFVAWLSRNFQHHVHVVCSDNTTQCEKVWELEYSNDEGQLCASRAPLFVSGGKQPTYFFLSYSPGGKDGYYYKHIQQIQSAQGSARDITKGSFDDIEILAYDRGNSSLYYLSTGGDPRNKRLYRITVGPPNEHSPECISCSLESCDFAEASFSEDSTYYGLSCLGPGVPRYILRSARGSDDVILQENSELTAALAKKALPLEHHVEVQLEGFKTWARVLVPASHRPELLFKHSLVVFISTEGPASQPVARKFRLGWETFLANNHVVATVDTRGSDNHGLKFKMAIQGAAGSTEGQDVIQTARALMSNSSLGIDLNKPSVVIGEGYGGFVALHSLRRGTPFNCSVVTSPITDLGQYYTATAERYMKTVSKQSPNYEETSIKKFIEELRSIHLLLIHGMADDRYHFQNSAILMREMQVKGIQFQSQISDYPQAYTGRDRALKRHYYQNVLKFLDKCLL